MRRYKSGYTKKALKDRRFIAISLLLAALIIFTNLITQSLKPISFELARAYASDAVLNVINDCVSDFFESEDYTYSDIVKLRYNDSGMVTAIEYDSAAINRLKLDCGDVISKKLSKFKSAKIKMPVGSLTGDLALSGTGPSVSVRVNAKAVPKVELLSELESAGVNQTRHEIVMRVTAEINLMLPPKTDSFTVVQDYVLAQTVVAGDVPQGNILID